ncbi:SDR family oxidoreductase [Parasulfuritortus cantonensis]|uniref:SDR family oxidoreductase n=1 Tax=Parasulfuritortus cantonensis TaxID=2528202 RepID=UPI00197DA14C|nr:SDR family oxidoreductase [Parasulfuritortus cantonensis]
MLIIGATSAIAEATARLWATEGAQLYLLARDQERLAAIADDLAVRGATAVQTAPFDATAFGTHEAAIAHAHAQLGAIDIVLVAHGTLGDQRACESSFELAHRELNNNAVSVISVLTHLANRLAAQKHGTIAVISSVAGDRGRQSNYIYGAAKGAVSIFLQGLRQRLSKANVHVLTIKPGFVDTPMTRHFKKGLLWVGPDVIAKHIHASIIKGRSEIYAPPFWRLIMFIITNIPTKIFNKLSL